MNTKIVSSLCPLSRATGLTGLLVVLVLLLLGLASSNTGPQPKINHNQLESTKAYVVSPAGYYVAPSGSDSNNGSKNYPFATIQKAAQIATPGTIIHVLPGTYSLPLNTINSGTPLAHITYISTIRWQAKIKTTGVSTSWINRGDYVDIIGFDITGDGAEGIYNLGSFTQIVENHIHDIPASVCSSQGGGGIVNGNYAGSDDDVIGNVIHDIGPSIDCNSVHGIYQANLRGHIWNNIIYRNAGWGIHLWHAANNVTVANNLVFENRKGGILVGAGDAPGDIVDDNTTVTNNIVFHNYGPAIYEYGHTGKNNYYGNNLIYANTRNILLQDGKKDHATIIADPEFLSYTGDGSGDYHLQPTSPAIGAGTTLGAPPTNIDSIPRSQGRKIDIGPYEYVPPRTS